MVTISAEHGWDDMCDNLSRLLGFEEHLLTLVKQRMEVCRTLPHHDGNFSIRWIAGNAANAEAAATRILARATDALAGTSSKLRFREGQEELEFFGFGLQVED